MSSAAVRAGRARLEAFRAARARGRREDEAREDDDDADAFIIPAVETTAPSTTRGLEPSEDAPREPRESTTTEDGGWDAGERRGVDGARARDGRGGGDARRAGDERVHCGIVERE